MYDQSITEVATTYTTHTKQKRQTDMLSVRFELAIPAIKWLQTYASEGTATEIGLSGIMCITCQLP